MTLVLRTEESVARSLIAQTEGMGPRLFNSLIGKIDSIVSLFQDPETLTELQVEGIGETLEERIQQNIDQWSIESTRNRLKKLDIGVLSSSDEVYPDLLNEIYDPPVVMFYKGDQSILNKTKVAIVGTRKSSKYGNNFASKLAEGLAEQGVCVVSGLAAGIDRASHEGALSRGDGTTVAVLGTGVDRFYPSRNKKLQSEIGSRGLLLTEYPPGTGPEGAHFPERNRIISGLSQGAIVVQAAARSGALITADCALEQGRDVFAVPGRIHDNLHDGCHRLIKQGAALVESPEDVLDHLQLGGKFDPPQQKITLSNKEKLLFETIHERPVHIDELVQTTEIEMGQCAETLLTLEDKGLIHGLPGQRYQRTQDAVHYDITIESND